MIQRNKIKKGQGKEEHKRQPTMGDWSRARWRTGEWEKENSSSLLRVARNRFETSLREFAAWLAAMGQQKEKDEKEKRREEEESGKIL